jgi:hypothetical protein
MSSPPSNHNLFVLFLLIDSLLFKVKSISTYVYPVVQTLTYVGYDERDAEDYGTEGYSDLEEEKSKIRELKSKHRYYLSLFLMILYSIFVIKNEILMTQLEENRSQLEGSIPSDPKRIESVIISKLLLLTEELLKYSQLNLLEEYSSEKESENNDENISNLCIKIITFISYQFPLVNSKTTEVR